MKERIDDLLVGGFFGNENVRGFATDLFDDAIELAAAMQERRSTERYGHDKYQDAAAIRKLKVS